MNDHGSDARPTLPAPGTPRRPRMPRAEREQQLIAIAEDIFTRNGYAGTTMEAIAEDHALATTPGAMNSLRAAQTQIVLDGLRTQPQLASVPDFVLEGFAEGVIGACERIAAWRITRPECTAEVATELVMALTWTGLERVAGSTLHTARSEAKPPLRTAG